LRLMGREDVVVLPAKTIEFPTPAVRPLFSALDCTKFLHTFGFKLPSWQQSLKMALEIKFNRNN